jgi:hypothetical protein
MQFKSRVYGIEIEDHCVIGAVSARNPGDFPQVLTTLQAGDFPRLDEALEKSSHMPPKKTIDKKAKKSPSKAVEKATILSKGEASSADGGCVVKIEACKS